MPLLQVRDFPSDVYDQIKLRAKQEHRTIAQQTIVLLKGSLDNNDSLNIQANKERRRQLLESIKNMNITEEEKDFDFVKAIREDRDR